jgi:predicted alpha/beta superfamily hydrolase
VTAPGRMPVCSRQIGGVYALDAPFMSGPLSGLLYSCALSEELPPLFAIGIGYPQGRKPGHASVRVRDLTPTGRRDFDAILPLFAGELSCISSGHAHLFLKFLLEELQPALAEAYNIDHTLSAIAGTSLGGLFALASIFQPRLPWSRVLAISPALWWGEHFLLQRAEDAVLPSDFADSAIFLCAGSLEGPTAVRTRLKNIGNEHGIAVPAYIENADIPRDMWNFVKTLKQRCPESNISARIVADESHNSIIGSALSIGLRTIYADLLPSCYPPGLKEHQQIKPRTAGHGT